MVMWVPRGQWPHSRHILQYSVTGDGGGEYCNLLWFWWPSDGHVASGQIPAYLSVTGGEYCNLLSFWWPSDGLVASGHIPAYLSVTGVEYCNLQLFWWPSDGHVTSGHVPDIPAIVSVVVNNLHCMPVVVRYIISPCNLLPGWLLFCWLDHSHSEALGPG